MKQYRKHRFTRLTDNPGLVSEYLPKNVVKRLTTEGKSVVFVWFSLREGNTGPVYEFVIIWAHKIWVKLQREQGIFR